MNGTPARWGPIPLRLIVAYGFLAHGLAKLEKGPDHFVAIVDAIGMPMSRVMAWLTILIAFAGGIAILLGAFVTLAGVPMVAMLLVAMFSVHWRYGFTSIKLMAIAATGPKFGPPGIETDLLYIACFAALVMLGAGPWSVDARIASRRQHDSAWPVALIQSLARLRHTRRTPAARTIPARVGPAAANGTEPTNACRDEIPGPSKLFEKRGYS